MSGWAIEFLPAHDEGKNIDETQTQMIFKWSSNDLQMIFHVPGKEWGFSKCWLWIWESVHSYKGTFWKMVLNRENYKVNLYP